MWLLSTDRAELRFFSSPESVDGGYAILSHLWDQEEQSFKDVQKINKRCKASGTNPRDLVCDKIRNACALADEHGYRWIWIDTCCIDKSSSAELSEAINSMFRYYSQASICYAYLRDVHGAAASPRPPANFARSMWHRRGWTLQELIAPPLLLFVSASWAVLGSKADYAVALEKITGIPATVLRLEQTVSEIPIAHRMSWAADRETTREEDIAYCLLGIFNITMPTLYGEGRRAFQRLQEEIMKVNPDTTLFAFSRDSAGFSSGRRVNHSIFASSPSQFEIMRRIFGDFEFVTYTPQSCVYERLFGPQSSQAESFTLKDGVDDILSFVLTPYGVRTRCPIITINNNTDLVYADFFWTLTYQTSSRTFAGYLPLRRLSGLSDRTIPLYGPIISGLKRTLSNKYRSGASVHVSWKTVYLSISPGNMPAERTKPMDHGHLSYFSPFRTPSLGLLNLLCWDIFAKFDPVTCSPDSKLVLMPIALYCGWHHKSERYLVIRLGLCKLQPSLLPSTHNALNPPNRPQHWANILLVGQHESIAQCADEHDCSVDHVASWPDMEKRFVIPLRTNPFLYPPLKYLVFALGFRPWVANRDCLELYFPEQPRYREF